MVTTARLDAAVQAAFPLFNVGKILPAFDAATQGARNDVALHRITTPMTVPETGEVLEATGLLALPAGATGVLPLLSWQHGTILSFDQVPSNLTKLADQGYTLSDAADSLETLFNLHRFAARGHAVIAADYVGKGPLRDGRGEGYAVKGVTTATCIAMLDAGRAALLQQGITCDRLFLHGWSQGALNTQWMHQALRSASVPITGTAVASPFNDLNQSWAFWASSQSFPLPPGTTSYPAIPGWVSLCMIVTLGSYERNYGLDGLLEAAIRPEYRGMARKYWTDYRIDPEGTEPLPDRFRPTRRGLLRPASPTTEPAPSCATSRQTAPPTGTTTARSASTSASPTRRSTRRWSPAPCPQGGSLATGVPVAAASHRATFLAGLYGDATTLGGHDAIPSWFARL